MRVHGNNVSSCFDQELKAGINVPPPKGPFNQVSKQTHLFAIPET